MTILQALEMPLNNGHFIVCHESDGAVREYDAQGEAVWPYKLDLGSASGRPVMMDMAPES